MRLDILMKRPQFVGLLAGFQGSGKTGAAASFAEGGPIKLFDLDRRVRGINGCDFIKPEWLDRVDVEQPVVGNAFKTLDEELEKMVIKAKTNQNAYYAVWIDSTNSISKMFLLESMKKRAEKAGTPITGKTRGSLQFATPDDYNYASMAWNQLIYEGLLPLNCHVIVTGWVVRVFGPDPKVDEDQRPYAPHVVTGEKLLLTEKLSEEVPGYFDDVFLFRKVKDAADRVTFTVETEGTFAKTRYPELRGKGKNLLDITGKSFHTLLKEKKVL